MRKIKREKFRKKFSMNSMECFKDLIATLRMVFGTSSENIILLCPFDRISNIMTIFLACSTKTCMYKYSRLYFHFCKINFYRQIKGKKFKDFHISLKLLTACCLLNWFHLHRWHNRSHPWIYRRGTLWESSLHLSKRTGSATFHTWITTKD